MDVNGRDIDAECGHPPELTIQDFKKAYTRGDLAARIIEIYPQETWQANPEVYEIEDNEQTEFEKAWLDLNLRHNIYTVLQRADVLSGVGRFGIILIGINDGKILSEPVEGINEKGEVEPPPVPVVATVLNPANNAEPVKAPGKARKIIYLRTFDESSVTIKSLQKDITNPRFGQPVMYSIKFQDANSLGQGVVSIIDVDVHWTRVLHICDNRTDSEVYGMPRLERVYNRILDLKKVLGGAAEMFWRGGFPGLSIETQPTSGNEVDVDFDKDKTKKEIEDYQRGLKRYLATVGMTVKSLAPQIADPTPTMNALIRIIAIAWAIPWRILMGAELGQLASEQDITAWNKRIARRQNSYVSPYLIIPFAQRLMDMQILPRIAEDRTILVFWENTHTVTEIDKATVAEKKTNAITKYVQGGGDMIVDPFHFLTLVMFFTDDEANSILDEIGDRLEADRQMKELMAEAALEGQQATTETTLNPPTPPQNGGAGNGNANGIKPTSRSRTGKPASAGARN